MTKTVTLDLDRYLDLVRSEATLDALDAAGVDNWEGSDFIDFDRIEKTVREAEIGTEE